MCSEQILNKGEIEMANGEMAKWQMAKWQMAKWQIRLRLGVMCQTVICARHGRLECLRSNVSKIMPLGHFIIKQYRHHFFIQII